MKVQRRLLSLVALLRRARGPVSRARIVEAMQDLRDGYPPDRPEAARKKLRRDLDLLRELGVIVTYDPVTNGYELAPSSRRPVTLDLDETDADLLVEAVRRLTDASTGRLRPKIESALEQTEARELGGREPVLAVHEPEPAGDPGLFETLVEAAWRRRRVRFDYVTLDGRTGRRRVEPWGLFRRDRTWHLLGRDEDREAPRCFRLVAMTRVDVLDGDGAFERPVGPEADVRRWATLQRWQWRVHEPVEVELACDDVAPLVARAVGGTREGDRVRLVVTNLDGLDDVVHAWVPRVRPVAPAAWAERHRAAAARLAARHGGTP